jgi:hypothetical protein
MLMQTLAKAAVQSGIKAAAANKEALAPVAMTGKAVLAVIWGTFWKSSLVNLAVFSLWVGSFFFTYLNTGNAVLMTPAASFIMGFALFMGIPILTGFVEVARVRRKLVRQRDKALAAQTAVIEAALEEAADWALVPSPRGESFTVPATAEADTEVLEPQTVREDENEVVYG